MTKHEQVEEKVSQLETVALLMAPLLEKLENTAAEEEMIEAHDKIRPLIAEGRAAWGEILDLVPDAPELPPEIAQDLGPRLRQVGQGLLQMMERLVKLNSNALQHDRKKYIARHAAAVIDLVAALNKRESEELPIGFFNTMCDAREGLQDAGHALLSASGVGGHDPGEVQKIFNFWSRDLRAVLRTLEGWAGGEKSLLETPGMLEACNPATQGPKP